MKKTMLLPGLLLCLLFGLLAPGRGEAHELADLKCEKNEYVIYNGTEWQCDRAKADKLYREWFTKRITFFVKGSFTNAALETKKNMEVTEKDTETNMYSVGAKYSLSLAALLYPKETSGKREKHPSNAFTVFGEISYGNTFSDDFDDNLAPIRTDEEKWSWLYGAKFTMCIDAFWSNSFDGECKSY